MGCPLSGFDDAKCWKRQTLKKCSSERLTKCQSLPDTSNPKVHPSFGLNVRKFPSNDRDV